ncbi:type II toxin-antitoxin system Phd/YefM family antitoxin [Microbacterium dauci]|uniref:Antitoxin n=1 Tax=Microbacterium dauci TaxID=3048008 RepID=A0ABT6ZIJ5_9MICO|nr:type II toxin-antitoxin system prevent-host-death family antitoxin [Microbacterium sp. LX3-4]MDJ1115442.1 type II toxin-antitoxin system prevent-host-death family antitoxin [Microbacterium sp. LX3-4]
MWALENLVSVTEVKKNTTTYIDRAREGETLVVLKNNKPQAAIVGVERMERLDHLEELEEDLRLFAATLVRMAADSGVRHSLDDVISDLGIELDD